MIVGTAGHIDHGKTTLVRALTGVETDRLAEERARGISIELGYAYVALPDGTVLGFIDVPGHERLVHTMAAGASGIDFGLLAVAADDGVMPQTREHLAILDLLGVRHGAVALTRADRVAAARIRAVEDEVRDLLRDGPLSGAPVFAVDGTAEGDPGVASLRAHLEAEARAWRAPDTDGLFRLAVDRAFTLPGHGTVATGTVHGGRLRIGDESTALVLLPSGRPVRVRALHVQNRPGTEARAGQRCALNLAGLDRADVARGDWVADARAFLPTRNLDVELRLLPDAGAPLATWTPFHVHLGTTRQLAHAVPLAEEPLVPGREGRVQLVFAAPVCAAPGDRFIVRDAGARRTVGGGRVLDPQAPARRRRSAERRAWLDGITAMLDGHGPGALLRQAAYGIDEPTLVRLAGRPPERLPLPEDARWLEPRSAPPIAITDGARHLLRSRIEAALERFHQDAPDEPGPEATRLRRIALPAAPVALWRALVEELLVDGRIRRRGPWLHLPGHAVALDVADAALAQRLLQRLDEGGFDPPWVRDLAAGDPAAAAPAAAKRVVAAPAAAERAGAGRTDEARIRRILRTLALQGELHQVVRDRFYHRRHVQALAALVAELAREHGAVEAARFRDATGIGRKRAIQILEYFDRVGLTRRVGDRHLPRGDSAWLDAAGDDPAPGPPIAG